MASRHSFRVAGVLACLAFASHPVVSFAKENCAAVEAADRDNDGTADLNEVRQAAAALFDKLDTDKDGTLSLEELGGRLSKADFTAGDPDKDGTLTKDEYLSIVEKLFNEADKDKEGTLDCKELSGASLAKLLK
jgi:Ca2+-binding EF-hand superfamily protein